MRFDVEYQLLGCVNGVFIDAYGKGGADTSNGSYQLEVDFPVVPLHWDPAFLILICCDRRPMFLAQEEDQAKNLYSLGSGQHNILDRSGESRFPDGKLLGRARASSVGWIDGHTVHSKSQIIEASFSLRIGEQIKQVYTPHYGFMQPLGHSRLLITTSYTFDTNFEGGCFGFTNYPVDSIDLKGHGGYQVEKVSRLDFSHLTLPRGGIRLAFEVQSSIANLIV